MPSLVGNKPNQVPTNGDLGTLAFQDANAVNITGGNATLGTATATTANITTGNITTANISGGIATIDTLTADSVNLRVDSDISNISPSLLLDFANTKVLDPRITFTRATTATFYDGRTVAKAEENLTTFSQEMDNAAWSKSRVTVTDNSTTAPDGTSTADTVIETTENGAHSISNTATSIVSGSRYVFSVFAKKGTGATAPDVIQLSWSAAGSLFSSTVYANFDLAAGTVTSTGAGAISSSIVSVGNGWYRCILVADAIASGSGGLAVFFVNNNSTATRAPNYAGVTTADVFIWGAQLEQRSAVTAYTATTTAPITNYIPALQTAASGVARFDHNPITQESLGLLIEEQRANLLTRSDDFADAVWGKVRSSVTSNALVAPDGTLTADKLVENTDTNTHYINEPQVLAIGAYTYSVYMKAGERTQATIRFYNTNGAFSTAASVFFNLDSGTLGSVGSGITASIQSVGNGWYRCIATRTTIAAVSTNIAIQLAVGGVENYTGDGYSGLYIWGAQLEAGAFPTSYIPTVASTVTRNADAASMTGVNFSSWFNNQQGSGYVEYASNATAYNGTVFALSDGTTNNRIIIRGMNTSSQSVSLGVVSGTTQWSDVFVSQTTASTKWSLAYRINDIAFTRNAVTPLTDTSALIPVVNQLRIGSDGDGNLVFNGTIRKITYFPQRLPNAELIEMTT